MFFYKNIFIKTLKMKEINISITAQEYDSTDAMDLSSQTLIQAAKEAAKNAYAPYSNFKVGAAVLLDNGKIIIGNNQENAAYPSGLCAERVAVFAASSQYPDAVIKAVAITAVSDSFEINTPISPCGACRQVLTEYEFKSGEDIKLILTGHVGKVLVINNVKTLLPFTFNASNLKK